MGSLVSAGGIHVPGDHVRRLETGLDVLCDEFGFPTGEEFKWSPGRELWMRKNLVGKGRENFFVRALSLAQELSITAVVVVEDVGHSRATGAHSAESCTTAFAAGEGVYSPIIFDGIKVILAKGMDGIGGYGLKIHSDRHYVNLYYWLLGDSAKFPSSWALPYPSYPYFAGPDIP